MLGAVVAAVGDVEIEGGLILYFVLIDDEEDKYLGYGSVGNDEDNCPGHGGFDDVEDGSPG